MIHRLRKFHQTEEGAVTVDWVVLTAALVGLGFGVVSVFANSTGDVGDAVSSRMTSIGTGAGITF
jgi:hypothetical protein